MNEQEQFQKALNEYMLEVATRRNAWLKEFCPNVYADSPYVFSQEGGRKYLKVVMTNGQSKSVHSFVDSETGDIYKAASWKAPALNSSRGNIFFENGRDALTPVGHVRYLK